MACKDDAMLCSLEDYIKQSSASCGGFELANCADSTTVMDIMDEHLMIGAAPVNVFKLLGITEFGSLEDVTGHGEAISGGDGPTYPASNVYRDDCHTWRSAQRGLDVIRHTFIGYDFGDLKRGTGHSLYQADTYNFKHIGTIRIAQSDEPNRRVLRARVERSNDGEQWSGVSVIQLTNSNEMTQISFTSPVPARYWRIRPLAFSGGGNDYWEVRALEWIEHHKPRLSDIQFDGVFLENRDRDYSRTSIQIKAHYDLQEPNTELSKYEFSSDLTAIYYTVSLKQCVNELGRPIVIGDIMEVPFEAQYTPNLTRVPKYVEVTDVTWSASGYTPGWQPMLQRITASPLIASQENDRLIRDKSQLTDEVNQVLDYNVVTDGLFAQQHSQVPQRGMDSSGIREFSKEEIDAAREHSVDLTGLNRFAKSTTYTEDAYPPNGEDFTEGNKWPDKPCDGDWHRLTYDVCNIPARLFKYNTRKGKWIYYETDRRFMYNEQKPSIHQAMQTPIGSDKVGK